MSPTDLIDQLVTLLTVEPIDDDLFEGSRQPGGVGRVFGGQVIAQALQAAQRTVPGGRIAHSLHAYFLRPGREDATILYRVARDFDGGSFTNRRVIAMQDDTPILTMVASFQRPEDGLAHQSDMPDVPPPEALQSERDLREEIAASVPEDKRGFFLRDRPVEIRPVAPADWFTTQSRPPVQCNWFRAVAPLPDDAALHRAVLTYASDMALLGTSMLPHGLNWLSGGIQTASLDHAVWLHEPFRADEWLLYATDSPWSGHARGLNHGCIYTRDGRLVASAAQEGLIRTR